MTETNEPVNPYEPPQMESVLSPGSQWAQNVSSGLKLTRIGLTLVYAGIILVLLSAISSVAIPLAGGGVQTEMSLISVIAIGLMLGLFLTVLGPIFCLAVPSESGARSFIIGSVVMQVGNLVAAGAEMFQPGLIPATIRTSLNLAGGVGILLFVLFMRKLALYIARVDLATRARNVLIMAGVVLVLVIVIPTLNALHIMIVWIASLLLALGGLIAFVMYANLVNWLRQALKP